MTAATAMIAATAAGVPAPSVAREPLGVRARRPRQARRRAPNDNLRRAPQAFLSPPQNLPVFRPERAQNRLQGHPSSLALYFRAWQDRPVANHRRFGQEAARAGKGRQTRPLSWTFALRNPLISRAARDISTGAELF